jgi:Phage integrase family
MVFAKLYPHEMPEVGFDRILRLTDPFVEKTTERTQPGTGTVRTCPALPFRSTMAQCSSRCSRCSILRPTASRGRRDAAVIGLLLGCGLRRSETVNLRLDQLQLRESHWVIVDMVGKGGRLRTVPVPAWCKGLIDVWIHDTGVTEGKVFRRVSNNGTRQDEGVTTDVVWYAVKRYAKRIGIDHLAPTIFVALAPASAMRPEANSNRFSFSLVTRRCKQPNGTWDAGRTSEKRSMTDFESHPQTMQLTKFRGAA